MDTDSKVKCSVCSSDVDDAYGGIQGYFGIIPVAFCEWCLSSIFDMVATLQGENLDD
jgi:hypothetical protein